MLYGRASNLKSWRRHEMAELIVDPGSAAPNPEVCDPCDINCSNLTRIYFDSSNEFLGANQNSTPGGFNYAYYICAVVTPNGAGSCPASAAQCEYAPVLPGSQWHYNDLASAAGAPLGFSAPCGYVFNAQYTQHVVYMGDYQHLIELWWDNNGWHLNNLTGATGAPGTSGYLAGYVFDAQGTQHVDYVGLDGHVYELWRDNNGWHTNDLTQTTGAPLAAAYGTPTGYAFATQSTQHVIYVGADGRVYELWWDNNGWHHNNLTQTTSSPLAVSNPCGYVFEAQGTQHVDYISSDGHVHKLWWDNSVWHHNDLTVAAGALPNAIWDPTGYVFASQGTQRVDYLGSDGHIYDLWWE